MMYTWCVKYEFNNFGNKASSFFYVDAPNSEKAKETAERWLSLSINNKTKITEIHKVGG